MINDKYNIKIGSIINASLCLVNINFIRCIINVNLLYYYYYYMKSNINKFQYTVTNNNDKHTFNNLIKYNFKDGVKTF